jgi:hypothetical protein
VAQAFSTRVAGLKRSAGSACSTSEAVKVLRREAGIEMAEHDLIDLVGGDAGIDQRVGRDRDDQALDGLGILLAERRMRPANDLLSDVHIHTSFACCAA